MMLYVLISLLVTIAFDTIFISLYNFIKRNASKFALSNVSESAALNARTNDAVFNQFKHALKDSFALPWQFYVAMIVLSIVIFLLTFHLLMRNTVLYLQELSVGIQQISKGEFETRVPVKYDDEMSIIADNINILAMDMAYLREQELMVEELKNDLITNVAHDLRTPLTSILGYLDIIHNKDLDEEQKKKYLDIVYDKSKSLQSMIEDLFMFTKINYGHMPLDIKPIDLTKLLEQEMDMFYPDFTENNIKWTFDTECSKAMIMADGALMARAIENVIGNAIKYGKQGKFIQVKLEQAGTNYKIEILNYGPVIPRESLPFLFDKFYRAEQSRKTTTGGTGLGLSITKAIIDRHKGQIRAESSMDGTVFEILLPMAQQNDDLAKG